ncbi:hypothetical protein [Noviherbaspirillum denitrificans]|uniref:Uncharacterized protein n=1 Tax=Noviherbaspirillum denitrificans TaxID=1968433 RepID=A0A254TDD4_9BURK|nr:hypothetical protein [Noviherbaspirillum denitrificans]OWW20177.1 hypothetical protein AYR66_12395 [Noviherbaspirillum denitrificans]
MKGLCEYVLEASMRWGSGLWTGDESAAYADYVNTTIHEDQMAEDEFPPHYPHRREMQPTPGSEA